MIEWINTYNNLIQIAISTLSLFATIVVSFLIYWLQKRHEREVEKIKENIRKKELKEQAHKFLIDNEEERDYLPWCVFAANLYRHEKHTRKIYTNFCRCLPELQNEILRIAQFNIRTIDNTEWVSKAIEALRNDIKKYELGEQDFLYDNAKYFHRAFERYRKTPWEDTPRVFEPINKCNQFLHNCFTDGKLTIGDYIDEYFYHYLGQSGFCLGKPIPPFEYVWKSQNLYEADEKTVCRWMLDLIFYITIIVHNRNSNSFVSNVFIQDCTDARAETFEDRYFETLFSLYYTYGRSNEEIL